MNNSLENLLIGKDIRPTANRLLVLSAVAAADHPVSQMEIEDILVTVDRSTVSRSVGVFIDAGILHLVDDGSGLMKYEMCHADHVRNDDHHPHFHCRACGRTVCLHDIPLPEVELPEGFVREKSNFVVKGLCRNCAARHH